MTTTSPTILVIDNDEGVVRAIATRFEGMGYRCMTAGTGSQGLALFREQPADLVVTDVNMPAGNGVAFVETLRQTSDVPVIVLTGFRSEYEAALTALPNVTVIEKPFETNALVDLVEAELVMTGCELP